MKQLTLAHQAEFQRYWKKTRREQFLEEMDAVMPWAELLALIAPHYSKGEAGRKPVGLEIMLRVYFLQQWFALSDPAVEDALYESSVLRRFAGIDLGRAPAPDETTILNFRHLLEERDLCGQMLDAVNLYLASRGIRITTGTIVDATILHAPSSTKNEKKERDPAMHQTRKGKQWYFGMKAHIGVDSKEGVVHSVCSSAASVSDVHMLPELLHGEEKKVWGDAGYQGQTEAIHEGRAPGAGHDQPSRENQGRCGRRREAQESREGAGAREGGVAVSRVEARLWIYEGALSRFEEESRMAVRGFCSSQYLSASPETGEDRCAAVPSRGVVRPPEAGCISGRQNQR